MRAAATGDSKTANRIVMSTSGTGLGSSQRLSLITRTDGEGLTAIDHAKRAGADELAEFLLGEQRRIDLFE